MKELLLTLFFTMLTCSGISAQPVELETIPDGPTISTQDPTNQTGGFHLPFSNFQNFSSDEREEEKEDADDEVIQLHSTNVKVKRLKPFYNYFDYPVEIRGHNIWKPPQIALLA